MAEKNFNNVRIVNKHDIEANWLKATNFTPKQGEIIVYDVDSTHSYERIKIGDGVHNVNSLPFYAGSWADLADKPFWSEGPTTVEWDGDTTGLAVSSDGTAYKVSDLKPSSAEIIGGKLTFSNGSVVEITPDIIEGQAYIISIYYGSVMINTTNGSAGDYSLNVTLPKPGIYFQKNTYNQLVSFSYGDETIYTIDEKYIPDTIARTSDVKEISNLVGDTAVSTQISTAINEATADDFGVYVQNTEPTNAVVGDIWIDTASDPSYIIPSLPQITSADNGKVLMVVNGTLQLVNLNLNIDANGVISI